MDQSLHFLIKSASHKPSTINISRFTFVTCYLGSSYLSFLIFMRWSMDRNMLTIEKKSKLMWQEQHVVPRTIKTHCHDDESTKRHHSEKVDSSFNFRESVRTSGCGLRGISRFGSPCQNCPSHTQTGEWRLSQEYSKHLDQPFSLLRSRLPHVCRIMFTPMRLITDILKKLKTSLKHWKSHLQQWV